MSQCKSPVLESDDLHDEARPEGPGIVTLGPVKECQVLASGIADLRAADWFGQYSSFDYISLKASP
jgi:hypothetical protein